MGGEKLASKFLTFVYADVSFGQKRIMVLSLQV